MLTFLSHPLLIGLDIQPNGIRWVQLKKIRRTYHVEKVAVWALSADIFMEGKIKHWSLLRQSLTEMVSQYGLKDLPAAIGLSANLVRMHHIVLPIGLSEAEVEGEIHARILKELPGMTEPLSIDYRMVAAEEAKDVNVFFAAVRQEYLTQYTECIKAAGLDLKVVDVDIYALTRAVCFALKLSPLPSQLYAILYLQHQHIVLVGFRQQNIVFHQHWEREVSFDLYEHIKRRLQHCLITHDHAVLHQLILCGHTESIASLSTSLTSLCHKQWCDDVVCCPNPFMQMTVNYQANVDLLQEFSPLMVACGLAMREKPKW